MRDSTTRPTPGPQRRAILAGSALMMLVPGSAALARARRSYPLPPWHRLPTEPFSGKQDDIAFGTPRRGWYGNGLGRLYRTDDAGDSWTRIWDRPGTFIRALGFVDGEVGVLGNVGPGVFPNVTDTMPLYRTDDGGHSWVAADAIDGPAPSGICAIEVQTAPAVIHAAGRVGGPAHYLRSQDGGRTWSCQDLTHLTAAVFDVKFQNPEVGFLAGCSDTDMANARGLILMTEDAGDTWRVVFRSTRPMETVWKLHFPSQQVGYGALQSYDRGRAERHFVSSSDGGQTWRERPLIIDSRWRSFGIGFLTEEIGWIGGPLAGLQTLDGGTSWEHAEFGPAVNKIRFVPGADGGSIFAVGQEVHRLSL